MVVVVTAVTVLSTASVPEAHPVRRRLPPWFAGLLVCVLATQTALNLARPLVSYRAIALGADATAVGLITAVYALLPILVAVPLGRATDRLGRSAEVLLLGVVLLGAAPLLLAGADALWSVGLASTALGFGHLAFMIAAQGLVAGRSSAGGLDRAFGLFTAVTSAGQLIGPLLAGALLGESSGAALLPATRTALLVAAACTLPAVPVAIAAALRFRRQMSAGLLPDEGPAPERARIPALLTRRRDAPGPAGEPRAAGDGRPAHRLPPAAGRGARDRPVGRRAPARRPRGCLAGLAAAPGPARARGGRAPPSWWRAPPGRPWRSSSPRGPGPGWR